MSNCIFCKIIAGEIPAHKIYENDKSIAFLDIRPVNPGHTLIVPKAHYENLLDAPSDVLAAMMNAAQKVARAVLKATGDESFNLGVNNGAVAGQVVFHLHLHIMPRHQNDGHRLWSGKEYQAGEAEKLAQEIRDNLA